MTSYNIDQFWQHILNVIHIPERLYLSRMAVKFMSYTVGFYVEYNNNAIDLKGHYKAQLLFGLNGPFNIPYPRQGNHPCD